MPEATGELPENVRVPDRNPFRVLRFVPAKFLNGCDDPLIIARVDFIHCHYKFFVFDCDLRCEPDFGEADVCISDLKPLLRYYLEPNFSGKSISKSCRINWIQRYAISWESLRATAGQSTFFMTSLQVRNGQGGSRAIIRYRHYCQLFSTT